tara:strand:- start:2458 stop:2703 length:246 start_codon:yes stop_codon:yes gene_type:complete
MAIISEKYEGSKIINRYKSSNIQGSIYETDTKKLILEFKGERKYEYSNVPPIIAASLRRAQSQGQYFNKEINKKFPYKLLK